MNAIKLFLVLTLTANCSPLWAQTKAPAKAVEQEIVIESDHFYFDGITNQVVYMGHVSATDHVKATLKCERLTVYLPANGGNPTNIVAETNVVVDVVDTSGTNHVAAERAVYSYGVVTDNLAHSVTNEVITFSGGNPKATTPKADVEGDPLVYNVRQKTFDITGHNKMILKVSSYGTNGSPFGFPK